MAPVSGIRARDDGLDAPRGLVNGFVLAVIFFWLPLAAAIAVLVKACA